MSKYKLISHNETETMNLAKNLAKISNKTDTIILTGDLGVYGVDILKDYLKDKYEIECNNIVDAGVMLFESEAGSEIAGGSGPTCLPLILFSKILKNNYKKILLVGTGSLHSKVSTNLSLSIPCVSHIVSLEVI